MIFFHHDAAKAIKISIPRPYVQCDLDDGDAYGGQQHAPLVELQVPGYRNSVFLADSHVILQVLGQGPSLEGCPAQRAVLCFSILRGSLRSHLRMTC